MDDVASDGLELTLTDYSPDDTCRLSGVVRSSGFSGRGHAWFNLSTIADFATDASQFPLPEGPDPELSGGYGALDGRPTDERLGVRVRQIDDLGHLGVMVRLAADVDVRRPKVLHEVRAELLTGYQELAEFVGALRECVNRRSGSTTLSSIGR
jgi:hypothetical protein